MEKTNEFMKTGKVFPLLMSMSVPMMLSMLIQSLYNIVDSIYVSRLGTDALTAVSLAFPLQNVVTSVRSESELESVQPLRFILGPESRRKRTGLQRLELG